MRVVSAPVVTTHRVPAGGLSAWGRSDSGQQPLARLDAGLEVEVIGRWGDWANVRCTNGWVAWVDGRRLEPIAGPSLRVRPTAPAATVRAGASSGDAAAWWSVLSASRPVVVGGRTVQIGVAFGGAVLAAIGSLLDWLSFTGLSASSFDVKANFLLSPTATPSGPDLGLLVVGAAAAFVVVTLVGIGAPVARWVGVVVIGIGVLFTVQLQRYLGEFPAEGRPSLLGSLGVGVYVTVVGGALMLVPPAGARA